MIQREKIIGPFVGIRRQEAVEQAISSYYINKAIREIGYPIDRVESAYRLGKTYKLTSIFLPSLFRTQIDSDNSRTMLRLKWRESEQQSIFIEFSRFRDGLKAEAEALAGLSVRLPITKSLSPALMDI